MKSFLIKAVKYVGARFPAVYIIDLWSPFEYTSLFEFLKFRALYKFILEDSCLTTANKGLVLSNMQQKWR